jgi:hypothetical protein
MTLNKAQFEQFVENYVSQIVEGLDVEQLEVMPLIYLFVSMRLILKSLL